MKRLLILWVVATFVSAAWAAGARDKVAERVEAAGTILDEIMAAPDKGIPEEVIGSAQCVGVVPSLLKGGFILGAAYGKGVVTCRSDKGWSAPAFFRVEGGSFGFQIGGQAVDLVMLVMNEQGMQRLLASKFKIGADASAAAGPVGRHAEAATDWKMRAELLTYSRARGLFAGISLNGSVVKQDKDDTRDFYGRMVPFRSILTGIVAPPAGSEPLLKAATKYAGGTPVKTSTTETSPRGKAAAEMSTDSESSAASSNPNKPLQGEAAAEVNTNPESPPASLGTSKPSPSVQNEPSPASPK
ncbi:MAG TPA: YSC84-related protein [Terriglobales bacterium]|nr:YSC84-related protein [Terriglobales bacterium]